MMYKIKKNNIFDKEIEILNKEKCFIIYMQSHFKQIAISYTYMHKTLISYYISSESEKVDPPLIYLFEEDHQKLSEAPALIYQLHINKKIR